jgi:uncharacterized protein YjbI with pentapeptide repeats
MVGAKMWEVDLTNAILVRANMRFTDLYAVNLTGANLTGADLRYTNLSGANLTGAFLTGALLPDGWQDIVAAY